MNAALQLAASVPLAKHAPTRADGAREANSRGGDRPFSALVNGDDDTPRAGNAAGAVQDDTDPDAMRDAAGSEEDFWKLFQREETDPPSTQPEMPASDGAEPEESVELEDADPSVAGDPDPMPGEIAMAVPDDTDAAVSPPAGDAAEEDRPARHADAAPPVAEAPREAPARQQPGDAVRAAERAAPVADAPVRSQRAAPTADAPPSAARDRAPARNGAEGFTSFARPQATAAEALREPAKAETPVMREAARDTRLVNGEPVRVLTRQQPQVAPAMALPLAMTPTAQGLVQAVEAAPAWRALPGETATAFAQRAGQNGISAIRIQLQPVELGMVTARLSTSGTQLSIEIEVESNDARQRLSADSEAILKAMRALGFDIDRVTIQQGPQSAPAGNSTAQQPTGRDGAFQQQASGDGEPGRQAGGGRDDGGQHARPAHGNEASQDRADGDLYI